MDNALPKTFILGMLKKKEILIKLLNYFKMEQNTNKHDSVDLDQPTHKDDLNSEVVKGRIINLFFK